MDLLVEPVTQDAASRANPTYLDAFASPSFFAVLLS